MTVGELVDRWLALKATTVEPTTVEGYRWIVERYVRPEFGARKVSSLRTLELDDWYQRLRAGGGTDGRALAGRTVRLCHTVMRQSLAQARKWGLIARNPAADATPPASKRTEVMPPSAGDVRRLLAAAFEYDPDFGVYLWILATTGCRRGEACALRWTDIDWNRREFVLRRSIAMQHFVATSLRAAGTPIATISARLGHRDKATTLNIYSHSLPAADAEAGMVMGACSSSSCSAR